MRYLAEHHEALRSAIIQLETIVGADATALSFRPINATVPTSPLYDAQMAFKGQALPASPSPSEGTPPYQAYPPTVSNYPAYPINRGLGNEIRS
jgi:hypothetical protein